ncbi:hypothetical protein V6N13_033826 [Hibiscus sabdariffa]
MVCRVVKKTKWKMEGLWRKLLGNQSHHDCFGCGNKVMETLPVYVKDDFFDSFCCDSLAGGSRNGRTRISEQMTRDRGIESKEGLFEIVDEWWQNPSNCLIGSVKFNVEAGVQWMGVGCGGSDFADLYWLLSNPISRPQQRTGRRVYHVAYLDPYMRFCTWLDGSQGSDKGGIVVLEVAMGLSMVVEHMVFIMEEAMVMAGEVGAYCTENHAN